MDNSSFAAERRRWHKEMEIAYQAICDLEHQNENLRAQLNTPTSTAENTASDGEQYTEREKEMLARFKRRETELIGELSAMERERNDLRKGLLEAAKEMTVLESEKDRMRHMLPRARAVGPPSPNAQAIVAAAGVSAPEYPGSAGMQDRQMEGMARELEKMRKDLLQTTSAMTTMVRQERTASLSPQGSPVVGRLAPSIRQDDGGHAADGHRIAALEEQARHNKDKITALTQQLEQIQGSKAASFALRQW